MALNGFYKVTAPTEVTVYVTTSLPSQLPATGSSVVGLSGILGQIFITGYTATPGPGYTWSFTIQTDTNQSVEGTQEFTGALLYPPKYANAPVYGRYEVIERSIHFYFTAPPQNIGPGWIVENLPMIDTPLRIVFYDTRENLAILEPIDGSTPPVIDVPVYVKGLPSVMHEKTNFIPAYFTSDTILILNQNIKIGHSAPLRELGEDLEEPPQEQVYIEEKDRGFSQGSILSLYATGPQESYLLSNNYSTSRFSSTYKQPTKFVSYERVVKFPPPSPTYQGSTVQIELKPTELGHLMSNMYLHVKMPGLKEYTYSPNIGRAIIKQVDLMVNETVLETLYDDWYIIKDQLFLDADEQIGLSTAINPTPSMHIPVVATGGVIHTNASDTYHSFSTSGTFTLNVASRVDVLVVGGGGAGASGAYYPTLSSNISYVISVPPSFSVNVSNTVGAYIGANVSIVSTDSTITSVVYVSSFNSTSLTLSTFGGSAWSSNITPANTTVSIFNGNGGGGGGVLEQSVFLLPGSYSVVVGNGGTTLRPNGDVSSFNTLSVGGGYGGAYGGAAGTVGTSNASYQYLSNIVYASGGGAGGGANVTTGSGTSPFTTAATLGRGGNGYAFSDLNYYGGGGGGASNTTIPGTLATPGGLGGGGYGYPGISQIYAPNLSLGNFQLSIDSKNNIFYLDANVLLTKRTSTGGIYPFPISIFLNTVPNFFCTDLNDNIYFDDNLGGIYRSDNNFFNVTKILQRTYSINMIFVDVLGNIYILDRQQPDITIYSPSGKVLHTIGNDIVSDPIDIYVDSNYNIYVADLAIGVYKIKYPLYTSVDTILDNRVVSSPTSIYLDSIGNLYVCDYTNGLYTIPYNGTLKRIIPGNSNYFQAVRGNANWILYIINDNVAAHIQLLSGSATGVQGTGGGGGGTIRGQSPGNGGSGTVIVKYSATANVIPSSDIIVPLEFFFCRRHSRNNKGRERLRKPYFPLCAMWNQRIYVRFTFQPSFWWSNAPSGLDLVVPVLITEEILLSDEERLYYMNTPLKYLVPKIQRESVLSFSAGNPQLELTANFPVQTIAWFFRNKNYETTVDGRFSDSRYNYGYTTQYIQTGLNLSFPSGNSNYVDVISSAKITLNNTDILSTFQGSLYYSFKQPIEHNLSVPSKNIYTYSFGLSPKEYNQGGYLNFSKLNSQTTHLSLIFNSAYTTQITQGYNLYLFYYGYTLLVFQGGFATIPYR